MPVLDRSLRHLRGILFVTVVLCVAGLFSLPSFPVAILPEVTFPRIKVIAESGERPAAMMEASVTRPLEQALATVQGQRHIRSRTERGGAEISVDFSWGLDMQTTLQLVNARINDVRPQLPSDTTVSAERMNPTVFPILGLSLTSREVTPEALWNYANYDLRPRLASVPGVARVVVQGGQVPEIAVEVRPDRLNAYRLSMLDVENAISSANVIRAVGRVDRAYQLNPVIVSGQETSMDQLSRVVVTQHAGQPVFLGDIADIHRSVQDRTTVVTANGRPAVLVNVVRQPQASTIDVVVAVKKMLAGSALPPGIELGTFYDQSNLVRDAVSSVRDAVLLGGLLSVLVLWGFLREWRTTLVCAAIIPITVLITFVCMRLLGMSMNLMTLGALAVGIGLVVDDAIVVVENVFRHLSEGYPRSRAVVLASHEIAGPMTSSTLTTVVVFLPLAFLSGVAGAFFSALAITLATALLVSLGLALFVSPSMCAVMLPAAEVPAGPWMERLLSLYERTLHGALNRRRWVPLIGVVILALTLLLAMRLGTGFMPNMDEGGFVLDYVTPPGTSLAESDRLLSQIDAIVQANPAVAGYSRRTGTELGFAVTEPNSGDYSVELKRGRRPGIDAVMDQIRDQINDQVTGVDVDFTQVLHDLIDDLAGAPAPIEIKLYGSDQGVLERAARQVEAALKNIQGAVDTKSGIVQMGPDLQLSIDPAAAGRLGLSTDQVASQAQAALFGDVATDMLVGDRQIGVRVRYPRAWRQDASEVADVGIRTPGGAVVPLSSLGGLVSVEGSAELNRENQRRMLSVTAQLSGRDLGSVQRDVNAAVARLQLPAGVTYEMGGESQQQAQTFHNLLWVLSAAVLLVYGVMLFQFESFTAPTVIVLLLPLSLLGVVLALFVTRTPLNVSSFMGAVMLVGIVVKNGILLLDQAQRHERAGEGVQQAVVGAARTRLRPILMTTLTAILGLVPLAMGWGAGTQMQQPLAIAVIGGLTLSTFFTLLMGPLIYASFRERFGRGTVTVSRQAAGPAARE
jgi:CzcA family heavy metal efflux pump